MNQLAALRDTVRLAEQAGMPQLPGSELGLTHLRHMLDTAQASDLSDAKLGRWLGWAQCALVAANVGVTLADMKTLNAKWSTTAPPIEVPEPLLGAAAADLLERYPWLVWTIVLLDPNRRAGANVAERTAAAATAAAELYGCIYEYCVDEDTMPDGTKYYTWYLGVSRAEHEHRMGDLPTVVGEVIGALIGSLPKEVDIEGNWRAGVDVGATRHRNEVDGGYPDRD